VKKTPRCYSIRSFAAISIAAVAVSLLLACADALAQDAAEKELGWKFSASVGWVWVGGNSESNSYAFGAEARHKWERSELLLKAGGTQTESTLKTRTAVGDTDDFVVDEVSRTEKTTELYFARGRYDYTLSKYFFLFGGADWLRNRFAGIESRELVALGAGNTWLDKPEVRFKTDYGVTYTFESEVVENPFVKTDFPGARVGYDFWWKLSGTTEFTSLLLADWNLDNTDDIRIDCKNELPVSVSDHFKLKPGLQLLWRNDPALTGVPLYDSAGAATGDTVLVPLEKLDTIFTVSLVFEM
jgi:putative salt-induced outer membrane protein YdiY